MYALSILNKLILIFCRPRKKTAVTKWPFPPHPRAHMVKSSMGFLAYESEDAKGRGKKFETTPQRLWTEKIKRCFQTHRSQLLHLRLLLPHSISSRTRLPLFDSFRPLLPIPSPPNSAVCTNFPSFQIKDEEAGAKHSITRSTWEKKGA